MHYDKDSIFLLNIYYIWENLSLMESYISQINAAAEYILKQDERRPEIAIVLGSGLGKLADEITNATIIPYTDIPFFPASTAIGHKGNMIIGELAGKVVLAMQGRFHYYEGYTMQQVTLPQRVMSRIGIKTLFVSNAAGGLDQSYKVGDLMMIYDHINLMPSPLIGPNITEFGPRFLDMCRPYAIPLRKLAKQCAAELGISMHEGIYVGVTGPTYETVAECRYFRNIGGDAVGMSTVPEVIVARHCGIDVFGISIITDVIHDYSDEDFSVDEEEVVIAADKAADKMTTLFKSIIAKL